MLKRYLFVLGIMIMVVWPVLRSGQLYGAEYEGKALSHTEGGTSISFDAPFRHAVDLYTNGSYDEVLTYVREIQAKDPSELRYLSLEVAAGILSSDPESYLESVYADSATNLSSQLRPVILQNQLGRPREAWSAVGDLVTNYPDECWVAYWAGIIAESLGKDSLALAYWDLSSQNSVCYWRSLREVIALRAKRGETDLADSLTGELYKHEDYRSSAITIRAWAKGLGGDWEEALSMLSSGYDSLGEPDLVTNLANVYYFLGRHNESIAVLEQALKKWPLNKTLICQLAETYAEVGLVDTALSLIVGLKPIHLAFHECDVLQSIALAVNDTLAIRKSSHSLISANFNNIYSGAVYLGWLNSRGASSEADSIFKSLVGSCSPIAEAQYRITHLVADNPRRALDVYDSVMTGIERYDGAMGTRINLLFAAGESEYAEKLASQYLEKFPGDVRILKTIVTQEYGAGHRTRALAWLNTWDSMAPGDCTSAEIRAIIYLDQGRMDEASEIIESLFQQYPFKAYEVYLFGMLCGFEKNDRLREIATRYLASGIHSGAQAIELASALSVLEEHDTADSILAHALTLHPNSAHLYYSRGWVAKTAGKYQLAQVYFQRALELDPSDQRYQGALVGATMESTTLDSAVVMGQPDTVGLARLSVDSVLALSASRKVEPGEYGGVVLHEKIQHIYRDRNRSLYRVHQVTQLCSSMATQWYGVLSMPFTAYLYTPHLILARTILSSGETIELKPSQVRITSPPVDVEGADMSDLRMLSFTFPAADSGAIVEFIVQFEGRDNRPQDLYMDELLSDLDPAIEREIELVVPSSWPILYEHFGDCEFSILEDEALATYRWRANNVDRLWWEENAPPISEVADGVRAGYKQSWQDVASSTWSIMSPKIEINSQIVDLARRISGRATKRDEKIAALFRFVADSIRYVAVEYGTGSHVPRLPSEVIVNRYGDCKDKVILLISLLKTIGIEAYPMLVASHPAGNRSMTIPTSGIFDHVIAYLPGEMGRFMDPTCTVCETFVLPVEYRGQQGLVLKGQGDQPLLSTPELTPNDDALGRRIRIFAQPQGGARIDVQVTFGGLTAAVLKSNIGNASATEARQFIEFQSCTGIWPEARMIGYDHHGFTDPGYTVGWNAEVRVDSAFLPGYSSCEVPLSFGSLDVMVDIPDTTDRLLDVWFESPKRVRDEFVIIPGPDWELDGFCLPWSMDTTWFAASMDAVEFADSIEIAVEFTLKTSRVPVAELAGFVESVCEVKRLVKSRSVKFRRQLDNRKLTTLQEALVDSPNDVSILVSLANTYLGRDNGGSGCRGKENRAEAKKLLSRALQVNPDNDMLTMRLALLHMQDGLFLSADSAIRAFAALRNGSLPTMLNMLMVGVSTELGDFEDALERLETIMTQAPSDQFRTVMVKLYCQTAKFDDARRQVDLMKKLGSDAGQLARAEFYFCLYTDNIAGAEAVLKRWQTTLITSTLAAMKTELYDRMEDWSGGSKEFRKLLDSEPDNHAYLNAFAWYLGLADSNLTEAFEAINRAIDLVGGCHATYSNTRGLIYLKMGSVALAEKDFTESLEYQGVEARATNYFFLGECCLAKNELGLAKQYYSKAASAARASWIVRQASARLNEIEGQAVGSD
ncbi:MAG: tetratricopeptide repeat protein [Candidatus Zixiibacteriota bacterium]